MRMDPDAVLGGSTIDELLGFHPPPTIPLTGDVAARFLKKVKGKRFGSDDAVFVSRYGRSCYEDHPLQWLEFSNDGSLLQSYCPGPDDGDASVLGRFVLKSFDDENSNYVIELEYGCKTTFLLKESAVTNATENPVPDLVTCQRSGCLQRHCSRIISSVEDFDELSGERAVGDPGVVVLRRCSRCRQVHYCSIECQRQDWNNGHREECKKYGKMFPEGGSVEIANIDDINILMSVLSFLFRSCITSGEERSWRPENNAKARAVGRRLYDLGGIELCRFICDELRDEFRSDRKRSGDARLLEFLWLDPVVPNWYP